MKLYGVRCDDPKVRSDPSAWDWLCQNERPMLFAELSSAEHAATIARERFGAECRHARGAYYGLYKAKPA